MSESIPCAASSDLPRKAPTIFASIIGIFTSTLLTSTASAVDFDAAALDIWLSPSDVCIGDSANVYARFQNLSDPGGPYGGAATFDARIIVTKPSGSSSSGYRDNWSFDFFGEQDSLVWNYTFDQAGTYTIRAEIYDVNGYQSGWDTGHRFDYRTETFTISNHPPTASRDNPSSPSVNAALGQNLTLRVRGTDCDSNLDYVEWYLDGNYTGDRDEIAGSSDTANHSEQFLAPGTYGVTAVVVDEHGANSQVSWDVNVSNTAPIAYRDLPTNHIVTVAPNQPLSFRVRGTDVDGNLDHADWYRDGNNVATGSLSGSDDTDTWQTSFSSEGLFGITAQVFDSEGQYDQVSWDVYVENSDPVASRDSPTNHVVTVAPDQPITFRVRGTDVDGNLDHADWYLAGQPVASGPLNGSNDTHEWPTSFPNVGLHGVTAQVFDTAGAYDSVSWDVYVENAAPNASRNSPNAEYITIPFGQSVTFVVLATDPDGNLATVQWFQDGSYTGESDTIVGASATASHATRFINPGITTITARVLDSVGSQSEVSWTVETLRPKRGMYIDVVWSLLDNPLVDNSAVQHSLLEFCKINNISYLSFYIGLDSTNLIPPRRQKLAALIYRAKQDYGIQEVGFIGGCSAAFDQFVDFHLEYPGTLDVINLENEFWHADNTYCETESYPTWLSYLQYLDTLTNNYGLAAEAYVHDSITNPQYADFSAHLDRLFLTAYEATPGLAYDAIQGRLAELGNLDPNLVVWPIFNSESTYRYYYQPYMGDSLAQFGVTDAEDSFLALYRGDSNDQVRDAHLSGFQYFSFGVASPQMFLSATQFSPFNNETGVPIDTDLRITLEDFVAAIQWFEEPDGTYQQNHSVNPVFGASGFIEIRKVADETLVESIPAFDSRISFLGNQAVINPVSELAYGTEYYVLIDYGVFESGPGSGVVGSAFPGISVSDAWRFTTVAECSSSSECDDGIFCNGAELCDAAGACQPGGGNPCTNPAYPFCDEIGEQCNQCESDFDCDDGAFCNGAETCDHTGTCQTGAGNPCVGSSNPYCDESSDECDECQQDPDCDDGEFCNGVESCNSAGSCQPGGGDPCTDAAFPYCDETNNQCDECQQDSHCDDGLFCNGAEICDASGMCQPGLGDPCVQGNVCNEVTNECELDCNSNGVADIIDLAGGTSSDCNLNSLPDECEIAMGSASDCDSDGVLDGCDGIAFRDDFGRADSNTVGNNWVEFESAQQGGDPDDNASIIDEKLRLQDDQFNIIPVFEQETKVVQESINVDGLIGLFIRFSWASLTDSDNDEFIVEWRPCGGGEGDWVIAVTLNLPWFPPNVFNEETADISAADGEACIDIRLRTSTSLQQEGVLVDFVEVRAGQLSDCNGNGIPDECDLAGGTSDDCNSNSVPDDCELASGSAFDCNLTGIIDACEIAAGIAPDLNTNGIPDECESNCGLEADFIIASPSAQDCPGTNVTLDAGPGFASYLWEPGGATTQTIQVSTPGTYRVTVDTGICSATDTIGVAFGGPEPGISAVLVSNKETDSVVAFNAVTGELLYTLVPPATNGLGYPNGITVDSAGHVYVASVDTQSVMKFAAFTGELLLEYTGTLTAPVGVQIVEPDTLLVASYSDNSVHAFDIVTGQALGQLVASGAGGLDRPADMLLTPAGQLLVSSQTSNQVLAYDAKSGAFSHVAAQGGGLDGPAGLLLDPQGNLLVASFRTDQVLRFNPATGVLMDVFVSDDPGTPGIDESGGLDGPEGMEWGSNGNLLICNRFGTNLLEFDGNTGAFIRALGSGTLNQPTYLALTTLDSDCNGNLVPDFCDLISGATGNDCNSNGVLDECELANNDCNANGAPDECELQTVFLGQQVITTVADGAWSVFAEDLDGDGDFDVISASGNDDKIAWYENVDGLGTFGPQQVITTTANFTNSVFAADLDGDGDVDALSASFLDDKIAWYENVNGLGTFGPQQVISTAADGARSVFAADLDSDGDLDVASASYLDDKIAWYENIDGLGGFGPQQVITTAAIDAWFVWAADLDGDGDADMLSASESDDKIAWYENTDGLGSFGPQKVITTAADGARSAFTADLDGDGDLDVASASYWDDKIAWYENVDGLGGFGPQRVITTAANGAYSVLAADLDDDGDLDVLSASVYDDKIAWYQNTDGQGNFGPQQVITTAVDQAHSVFAADLDGDGDVDALSASREDDKIAWYENITLNDCNANGALDECDIASATSNDCNRNSIPDECDIASGTSDDFDSTGIPDECESVWLLGVLKSCTNAALEGGIVATDNGGGHGVADANGNWQAEVPYGWSGTLAPCSDGWRFTPPDRAYNGMQLDASNQDFIGTLIYDIDPPACGDDFVGVGDFSYLATSWLQTVPPASVDHDFDCDGFVGVGDISYFVTAWLKSAFDPTIVAPPCGVCSGAMSRLTPEYDSSVEVKLVAVSNPGEADITEELPEPIRRTAIGSRYYLEAWARDASSDPAGLTSAYVDIGIPSVVTSVQSTHVSEHFNLLQSGEVAGALVDELGGSTLQLTSGSEGAWVRVGAIEVTADAPGRATYSLQPSSTGIANCGRGAIPWSSIAATKTTVLHIKRIRAEERLLPAHNAVIPEVQND
ncbi:MAG TPA: FG-GAP-like repeat-containing protein [Phycisphaerae bacterium]|nr:FG-GAP-like repeat-containing protein [Phycisphaerae bacterium]